MDRRTKPRLIVEVGSSGETEEVEVVYNRRDARRAERALKRAAKRAGRRVWRFPPSATSSE